MHPPDSIHLVENSQILTTAAKQRLKQMYSEGTVVMADGTVEKLDRQGTGLSPQNGEFIAQLICENNCRRTLEIGLAYGFSAVYVFSAGESLGPDTHHIVIDPFQTRDSPRGQNWKGIGLDTITALGWKHKLTFYEKKSLPALSNLIDDGITVDFIFIDGDHKFDATLIDFVLGDTILAVGGVVVLDDMGLPSVRKAARFIERNMPYHRLAVPKPPLRRARMAAFRKIDVDKRDWRHFVDF